MHASLQSRVASRRARVVQGSVIALSATIAACSGRAPLTERRPAPWPAPEAARYLDTLAAHVNTRAPVATGRRGAVAVAYGPFAARAGLDMLERGGNAMDAALTTALTQVAVTAGSPVSYFGIMSLVYYDARRKETHTLWAGWNTVKGETAPLTIPGAVSLDGGALGTVPSGRTALVGGFMRGVEAAHRRFGRQPWGALFDASIFAAERGMRVHPVMANQFAVRAKDLARLPATRAILLKPDGTPYVEGDTLRQPALAAALRSIATDGADHMYAGAWGERLVAAVQADGGRMTMDDLRGYRPIWGTPLRERFGAWEIVVPGAPNTGGVAVIEAQRLGEVAGIPSLGHWSRNGESLRRATAVTQNMLLGFFPPEAQRQFLPGRSLSDAARVTPEHAAAFWPVLDAGKVPLPWAVAPRHSDDVVVIDAEGNMAAITHSINCVYWGKTAINIDGISIGDPASYQQAAIARAGAGNPLPDPMETGLLFKDDEPVLAFASMGSGLHQRTFSALMSIRHFGMTVDEAIDAPDFFIPAFSPRDSGYVVVVPRGRFPTDVLQASQRRIREIAPGEERLGGEGVWVGISRDPRTGALRAASHNRSNAVSLAH